MANKQLNKLYALTELVGDWEDIKVTISVHSTKQGAENAKKIKETELDELDISYYNVEEIEILD